MKQETSFPFWVVVGAGAVVVAALGFMLASLGHGTVGQAPSETPAEVSTEAPTEVPRTASIPTVQSPAATPLAPPTPAPTSAILAAPDFTLERSGGGEFTLTEQLAEGPVALVFVRSLGG